MVKAVVLVMLEPKTFEDASKIKRVPGVKDGFLVFMIADKIQKLSFVRYVETLIER